MGIKETIFSNITDLPNCLNFWLMKCNISSRMIFGQRYIEYKHSLQNRVFDTQEKLLLKLINHALQNVEYYREKYAGVVITSVEQFVDILEFIDKDTVMSRMNDFLADDIDMENYTHATTGGTSGKPLQLLVPKDRYIVELGTVHSYWEQFGYDFSPRVVLRNHRVKDRSYQVNPITKEIIFDGFDLTERNFRVVYEVIRKYNIPFVQCYPSSGFAFAKFIHQNNLDVPSINAFFLSSENAIDYQIKFIESLGIRVFNLYGHSEKLIIAGSCPYCNCLHVDSRYGYLELIGDDGTVIDEPNVFGEIVGTTFNNFGMPLIRYRTGDYAAYADVECECGFKGKTLSSVRGRWNGDKIYNLDGSYVTTTALNLHSELYSVIDGLQYRQKIKGYLDVYVVPGPLFLDTHKEAILHNIQEKLNVDCVVEIHCVETLLKQPNGKFLLLISEVTE